MYAFMILIIFVEDLSSVSHQLNNQINNLTEIKYFVNKKTDKDKSAKNFETVCYENFIL